MYLLRRCQNDVEVAASTLLNALSLPYTNCKSAFLDAASHWSHGISVAYTAAYLLAWITAGIYLLTWAVLFSFRRSFSHPPAGQPAP